MVNPIEKVSYYKNANSSLKNIRQKIQKGYRLK